MHCSHSHDRIRHTVQRAVITFLALASAAACLIAARNPAVARAAAHARTPGHTTGATPRQRRLNSAGIAHPPAALNAASAPRNASTFASARKSTIPPIFKPDYPGARVVPASTANFTQADRPNDLAINMVVIHVAEGTALGTAHFFQSASTDASANYVVARTGRIYQMVPEHDIAWHAGNWQINEHSVGIEHEGYTSKGDFSDAQYRGSASLTAHVLDAYAIRPDRHHVIGHNEVPDPNHHGEFGGVDHHTDPGRYWQWRKYMAYVRMAAHDTLQVASRVTHVARHAKRRPVALYQPTLKRPGLHDLFVRANCKASAARSITVTLTLVGGKHRTQKVALAKCTHWTWLGMYRLRGGRHQVARISLPAHTNAPKFAAVAVFDPRAPQAPTNLTATAAVDPTNATSTDATVNWFRGRDDVGVWGYQLTVNDDAQRISGALNVTKQLTGLSCATNYTIAIQTIDRSGNLSPATSMQLATPACTPPAPTTPAPTNPTTQPPTSTQMPTATTGQ